MTYGFFFPEILSKDTAKIPNKKIHGRHSDVRKGRKYDHFQMVVDRLSGMMWNEIAKKHNVNGGGGCARSAVLNSNVVLKLSPQDVKRLDEISSQIIVYDRPIIVNSKDVKWMAYSSKDRRAFVSGLLFIATKKRANDTTWELRCVDKETETVIGECKTLKLGELVVKYLEQPRVSPYGACKQTE